LSGNICVFRDGDHFMRNSIERTQNIELLPNQIALE